MALIVKQSKITGYLLSSEHPEGRHKEQYFKNYGFTRERWEEMELVLKRHFTENDIISEEETGYGIKYVVEGQCACPNGLFILLRTVWMKPKGEDAIYLITAYPCKR